MDRTLILAVGGVIASSAGLLLLALQYLSPLPQPERPELVVLAPAGLFSLQARGERPAELALLASAPARESAEVTPDASPGSAARLGGVASSDPPPTNDATAAPVLAPAMPPALDPAAPARAVAGSPVVRSPVAQSPVASRPARSQLATVPTGALPSEKAHQEGEPTGAGILEPRARANLAGAAAAGESTKETPAWHAAAPPPPIAETDNLHAARTMAEVLADLPREEAPAYRERVRPADPGLRWRDVFTDHLGPDR
jgi:hypothetical protein